MVYHVRGTLNSVRQRVSSVVREEIRHGTAHCWQDHLQEIVTKILLYPLIL